MIQVAYRHFTTGAGVKEFATQEEFDEWWTPDNFEFKVIGIYELA